MIEKLITYAQKIAYSVAYKYEAYGFEDDLWGAGLEYIAKHDISDPRIKSKIYFYIRDELRRLLGGRGKLKIEYMAVVPEVGISIEEDIINHLALCEWYESLSELARSRLVRLVHGHTQAEIARQDNVTEAAVYMSIRKM